MNYPVIDGNTSLEYLDRAMYMIQELKEWKDRSVDYDVVKDIADMREEMIKREITLDEEDEQNG